ncbi:serine peptidase [Streptomyces sp. NPDC020875]|uniref:serine peptidase n=1 Tax=Streptomyces sp. NPDC020875 TaxID=3154898 RepID=UPI0033E361DA
MRILGVHGIGNYWEGLDAGPAAEHMAGTWRRNLARGPLGEAAESYDLTVAYYAHLLQEAGGQSVGGGVPLAGLSVGAERSLRWWLEELELPAEPPQGLLTWPFRQALSFVANREKLDPERVEAFADRHVEEVAAYFSTANESRRRTRARDVVLGALRERSPQVVIAHSLGSVVAYEALWRYGDEGGAPVDLLITLGSPLAIPHAVFHRLDPAPSADGLGARPPVVRRWVNIADIGDVVAVPKGGVARRFLGVTEDITQRIHAFDFHLVANYLATGAVARALNSVTVAGEPAGS